MLEMSESKVGRIATTQENPKKESHRESMSISTKMLSQLPNLTGIGETHEVPNISRKI